MHWVKLVAVHIIGSILFLTIIELGSGTIRFLLGYEFLAPLFSNTDNNTSPSHPCIEMKTDVLLSHVPNTQDLCQPKEGKVVGEYVSYDVSTSEKSVILTLGGSTTSGFYQHFSNGDTYPKLLADLVKEDYSVLNGGVGGYSTLQDLYKFIRDGSRIKNLAFVISLNGINELPNYQGANTDRATLYPFLTRIQHQMNTDQIWIDQRMYTTYVSKLLPNIISFFSYIARNKTLHPGEIIVSDPVMLSVDAADRWEKNITRLHRLVALEGASYMVFLQPTMGLVGLQSKAPVGSSDEELLLSIDEQYLISLQRLYGELKNRCSKYEYCYDISDAVPPTGNVYSDARHHNQRGNKLLAMTIRDSLYTHHR